MTSYTLRPVVAAAERDRSFWLQDIGAGTATEPLVGTLEFDVAIIGGGYCGLWTALRLKEQKPSLRVAVLEADFCGSGASGRNGGQVHSWFAEIDLLERIVGPERAMMLSQATCDAIEELATLQAKGIIAMDLRLDGWLWTASSKAQEGAWRSAMAGCATHGVSPLVPMGAEEIRRRTGSGASYIGVVEGHAGSVQPAKLAIGLRSLALSRGIALYEKTPVTRIDAGDPCTLATPSGSVRAARVVVTTNAWASSFSELRRYIFVVDSQIIATAPVPTLLDRIGWTGGESICDAQAHVLYYQRTPEGRVVFGRGSGHVAFRGNFGASFNRTPGRTADNQRELHRVYPELHDTPIEYDWKGPIDCTADHLPIFGNLKNQSNIFFGAGFNGTGIVQTSVGGRILASLVLGNVDKWSHCGLVGLEHRTPLPSEPFRYLGARVVRRAIRIRNDAEIENRRPGAVVRYLSNLRPGH